VNTPTKELPILVIDDSDINLAIMEAQFSSLQISVVARESAIDALEAMRTQAFSMIFTDIAMPGMDGVEFCRQVRASSDHSTASIPIIALTSNVTNDDRKKYSSAGFSDVMEKPLEVDRLSAMINHWLNSAEIADDESISSEAQDLPIDLDGLPRLLGTEEPSELVQWLHLFLRLFPDSLTTIKSATEQRDTRKLKDAAHKAKGSARSAAAPRLARILGELEDMATEEHWPEIAVKVNAAVAAFDDVKIFVKGLDYA